MMQLSTRERIIEATLDLVSEKGYKGATTREIAEKAKVNEVTIFRQFGSKKGIVEAIIEKYAFVDELEHAFANNIVWDIEEDLTMLVREYQTLLDQKRTVILLSIKEEGKFPELDELIKQIPYKYLHVLKNYFITMIKKEKIKPVDPTATATNFIFLNFGYFLMKNRLQPSGESFTIDDFVKNNIKFFIRSLQ